MTARADLQPGAITIGILDHLAPGCLGSRAAILAAADDAWMGWSHGDYLICYRPPR